MRHTTLLFSSSLLLLFSLAACTPRQQQVQEVAEQQADIDVVHSQPDYFYSDSLMQGSHRVVYSISRRADDSLAVVEQEDGTRYKDNRYRLAITKDGTTLFSRSFTRADFRSMLSGDFRSYGIMDGMRFDRAADGKLYFKTCVSYPESDMSCPFILTIGPDGSYTIEPDNTIDDDDLPPTQEGQETE